MRICILGTGQVGEALGKTLAQCGHKIVFGSRNPQSERARVLEQSAGQCVRVESYQTAVNDSEIVMIALPWKYTEPVLAELNLKDKIVVDCTNPLKEDLSGLEIGFDTSAGEMIEEWAIGAQVVKAFNTVGVKVMSQPVYGRDKAVMLICSDHESAKKIVTDLCNEIGFEVLDCGGIAMSRSLEEVAMLWISLGFRQGLGPDFAFKLLRR